MSDINDFIQRIPKAENHIHVEGIVPWEMITTVSDEDLESSPPWFADDYRFEDFSIFGKIIYQGVSNVLTSPQGYAEVARRYFEQLVAQNVVYVELSLSVLTMMMRDINVRKTVDAIRDVIPDGLTVALIAGINNRFDLALDSPEAEAILNTDGIVGIDLHGDERLTKPENFRAIYEAAAKKNYVLRAHVGELMGVEMIREVLDVLGISRIEHGVTAQDNPAMRQRFIADHITLDMCPTSNVKLCTVPDYKSHPIGDYLRSGISVTCSTDDPAIFNISLVEELQKLANVHGFTFQEIAQLQMNAFDVAIVDEKKRQSWLAQVNNILDGV